MIRTFTGPMHSGKTEAMISCYNKIWNKKSVICFKPKIDTRDKGVIKSKNSSMEIKAICIDSLNEILNYVTEEVRTVFIDEVQMLKGDVSILTFLSVEKDMDIYLAGLNMTSEQKPFLIMPDVLAVSDEIQNIKASCYDCGRGASYTYYVGVKDKVIVVGDKNYIPLCAKCLNNRKRS